jgi:disulfide bond formation protein DsbB
MIAEKSRTMELVNRTLPYIAWLIALSSLAGSLFFSEVMELPPCVLCWYQRIAMYPLVLVIAIGIVTADSGWKKYAMALSLTGFAISIYHNLVYYGVIPEGILPCSEGVPCNEVQIEWLGFITIPLLGLTAFLSLIFCVLFYKPEER